MTPGATLRRALSFVRGGRAAVDDIDISHLASYDEVMNGPLQRDEALLLFALVRVLRPETLVEIGFLDGHSARNFLQAMDADARPYSFDISEHAARWAQALADDARFTYRERSQDALVPEDINGRRADFVFLDASHDLALNRETFRRLQGMLADRAILAVHDTGSVPRALFEAIDHWALYTEEGWVDNQHEVAPDERAFVNWILDEHPDYSQLHLHATRTIRCGLTLLQRRTSLPRPASLR